MMAEGAEAVSFSVTPIILAICVILMIAVWLRSRRIGPVFGVLLLGTVVSVFADPTVAKRTAEMLTSGVGSLLGDPGASTDEGEGEPTSSPSASSEPSSEATPVPSETPSPAPQAPESTTNWGEVWMIVAIVAASLIILVFVVWLTITIVRRSRVKHREFVEEREKAKAEKARREALLAQIAKAWAETTKKHDDLDAEYLSYQKDLKKIARYPLMTELAVPLTKKAIRAMTEARNRRPSIAPEEMEGVDNYREAVTSFELALRAAISNAKREGLKNFSEKEQKDLERVQDLLRMAEDKAGSPHERRSAYERAIKTLQGILGEVPQEALLEIETRAKEEGIVLALSS